MRAFVTGASGFIGSHLVRVLSAKNWDVRSLVHVTPISALPGVKSVIGDIRDGALLEKAIDGVDVVFHLAAAVGSVVGEPQAFAEININGLNY